MTLLSAVNRARDSLALPRVTALVGSTDPAARRALELAHDAGEEIAQHYAFSQIRVLYSFATVDGQADYTLPDDLHSIIDDTLYDQTQRRKIFPVTAQRWAALQAGVSFSSIETSFRVIDGALRLFPTPSSVRTIALEYWSKDWVSLNAGGAAALFESDSDTTRFPERLLRLSLKWRELRQRGLDYAQEEQDYRDALELAVAADEPTGDLWLQPADGFALIGWGNIPDGGYG